MDHLPIALFLALIITAIALRSHLGAFFAPMVGAFALAFAFFAGRSGMRNEPEPEPTTPKESTHHDDLDTITAPAPSGMSDSELAAWLDEHVGGGK